LRQGDIWGTACKSRNNQSLIELKERITALLEESQAFTIKDLRINGNQLHQQAKIPRSEKMGILLNYLLECVLEDPKQNEPETLLELARKYYDSINAL